MLLWDVVNGHVQNTLHNSAMPDKTYEVYFEKDQVRVIVKYFRIMTD